MHETEHQDRMSKTQWKAPHYGVGAGLLVVGLLAGRAFFPLEIPKPFIVEKEKRVEVPVEKLVEKRVPYEVITYVDRVVENRVEVPVDRIIYRDRIVDSSVPATPAGLSAWRQLSKGISREQVRSVLGQPSRISGGVLETWDYGTGYVSFSEGGVYGWYGPY